MSTMHNENFFQDEIYVWVGVSTACIMIPQHIVDTARMLTLIVDNADIHAVNPRFSELTNIGATSFKVTKLEFDFDLDLGKLHKFAFNDFIRNRMMETITSHISETKLNWSVRQGTTGAHYYIKVINPHIK